MCLHEVQTRPSSRTRHTIDDNTLALGTIRQIFRHADTCSKHRSRKDIENRIKHEHSLGNTNANSVETRPMKICRSYASNMPGNIICKVK